MGTAYIGLGSNLGNRLEHLQSALSLCRAAGIIPLRGSHVYETEYDGPIDSPQPRFLNCVVRVRSGPGPHDLLASVQQIERTLGRTPTFGWMPRSIDLDVLMVPGVCLRSADLILPHPRMWTRGFVMVPLAELDPDIEAPDGRTAARLAAECMLTGPAVRPYAPPRSLFAGEYVDNSANLSL